jgi:hypothetical protein
MAQVPLSLRLSTCSTRGIAQGPHHQGLVAERTSLQSITNRLRSWFTSSSSVEEICQRITTRMGTLSQRSLPITHPIMRQFKSLSSKWSFRSITRWRQSFPVSLSWSASPPSMAAHPHYLIRIKCNLGKSLLMRAYRCLPPDWLKFWIRTWEGIRRIKTSAFLIACFIKKLAAKSRFRPVTWPNLKSRHLKLTLKREGQTRTQMQKASFWRHHRWQRTCWWAQIKIIWLKIQVHQQIRPS